MSKEVIYNAHIITMDADFNIYPSGSLLIENGIIKQISTTKLSEEGAQYIDAKGKFVLPGLINAHTHIPMTMLRGYADDLPLQQWLSEYIFPAEAQFVTPENVQIATRLGLLEMIKSGTTCFNDMYFFEDIIGEESKNAGMRAVIGEAILDFPTPSGKNVDEGIAISEELQKKWNNDPIIHPIFAPHAPYTCCKENLLRIKKCAEHYNSLLHIHLSETNKEVQDSFSQTGKSPVQYLNDLGILGPKTIAAHCVWFSDQDIDIMAKSGASVCHCPKSNLKLASGMANIQKYTDAGINVAIGTDGTASNNNLNMIEEMRFASLLSKAVYGNPEATNAKQALTNATINGAKALGIDTITGSIETGKHADMIFIDVNTTNMCPVYNEYSAIVYAMNTTNICDSMVYGRWIMRDHQVLSIDEQDTLDRIHFVADSIRRSK